MLLQDTISKNNYVHSNRCQKWKLCVNYLHVYFLLQMESIGSKVVFRDTCSGTGNNQGYFCFETLSYSVLEKISNEAFKSLWWDSFCTSLFQKAFCSHGKVNVNSVKCTSATVCKLGQNKPFKVTCLRKSKEVFGSLPKSSDMLVSSLKHAALPG